MWNSLRIIDLSDATELGTLKGFTHQPVKRTEGADQDRSLRQ